MGFCVVSISTGIPREIVDCGECRLCCQSHNLILVSEDFGDDPSHYVCTPLEGQPGFFQIAVRENGDCHYLGENGCTIHDQAPNMCQAFSCISFARKVKRKQLQEGFRDGYIDAAVLKRGRELLRDERNKRRFPRGNATSS